MAEHPITPSSELVTYLRNSAPHGIGDAGVTRELWLIHNAFVAGADQELEACCEWVGNMFNGHQTWADELRIDRRPKPPSLKEQALDDLRLIELLQKEHKMVACTFNIRRALEALND